MEGITRADLDKAEAKDFALGKGPLRPRAAATMILIDRTSAGPKVLMGRRHRSHAFMPGKFVFPGGRTDSGDSRVAVAAPLPDADAARLVAAAGSAARARAIALSAVRETYEEAGLLIGDRGSFATKRADWEGFRANGVAPSLAGLRYIARAITPPGRVRRYDTHFFAAWRDSVAVELERRVADDPLLKPGGPVPFFRMVRDRFVRELL